MKYQGGKERIAARIADAIGQVGVYYEPFIGGLSVASRVHAETYILSDSNEALITLYKAWCEGWRPDMIDEAEYARLKDANTVDYKAVGAFDSDAFWDWASEQNARVLVSEYSSPDGWASVLDIEKRMTLRKDGPHETRVERLFQWKP